MNSNTIHVLFLCTGNSCRSQMAEGYGNLLGENQIEAKSAGIEAHGKNPRAIAIMAEEGVDISNQESTVVTDEMLDWADLLVTVCGHADEHCPTVTKPINRLHWPLTDPAKAEGNEDEVTAAFRTVRDEVKERVKNLLKDLT